MRHTFIIKYLIIISFFMTGNLKAQTIEVEINENVELMSTEVPEEKTGNNS